MIKDFILVSIFAIISGTVCGFAELSFQFIIIFSVLTTLAYQVGRYMGTIEAEDY